MSDVPYDVAVRISSHLEAIAAEFRPGAKLTLLVRNDIGAGKDADVVFTDDKLLAAIAALQHRHTTEQSARKL
jgi:hypothetical protein